MVFAALLIAHELPAAVEPLVIGDSMSEEYAFEIPFSAPDSNPLVANTSNWIEILAAHRPAEVDFGSYGSLPLTYPDLRNGGFSGNFGFPGATAEDWKDIVESTLFSSPELLSTRLAFESKLTNTDGGGAYTADAVVIFLGGNDVDSAYGDLYDDMLPAAFVAGLQDQFEAIFTFIRGHRPAVPIIFVTIPDVGATPDLQLSYPDPAKRATASAHLANLNALLTTQALGHGATVADLFAYTQLIIDPAPVFIGAIEMIKAGAPENPPDHLFCKDGYHPATASQAVIGNLVVEGFNAALGLSIPPLPSRELIVYRFT